MTLQEESRLDAQLRVGFVSTYPPRECGIASYTRNLSLALLVQGHVRENVIVAINEEGGNLYSDKNVRATIDQHLQDSYRAAASFLNDSGVAVTSVQHEYGIFGGEWGEYILDLYANLEKPIVTTFHTVMAKPPEKARQVLAKLTEMSQAVVVTIASAAKLLEDQTGLDPSRIRVIGHGATSPERRMDQYAKRELGLQKRFVLATLGLLSEGKGIEYAIKALPQLVKERPDLLYLVIGETHPEVRKHEGEAYRDKLVALAERLRVETHVRFIDNFLPEDRLSRYLQAVDVYVAPYLGRDQVSSGTLTLALSHGKAIVSTPSTFSKEVLSDNRGLLCKFANAKSLAECVHRIIDEPGLKRQLEANAFKYGREVGWTRVADEYAETFRLATRSAQVVRENRQVS
jgi:glycosyltransferase involved in cell wall biosynthesis